MNICDLPEDPTKRWEWIKYQLRIGGTSAAQLARQLGVHDRALRRTKNAPYPRVERAIATALGLTPVILWPDRWNIDGTPKRRRPNRAESRLKKRAKDTDYDPVSHFKASAEA